MNKGMVKLFLVAMTFCVPLLTLNNAIAYEGITAQEAYDLMLANEEASMLDVRSLEELRWVGSPAFEAGGAPISYVIPWMYFDLDHAGNLVKSLNEYFVATVEAHFKKSEIIMIFCRSGGRRSSAAVELETAGFLNVYEIDNYSGN